jgi:uncharacterized protein YbaR (Trm112 family)
VLIPVAERPFIEYQIAQFRRYDVTDLILCVGHLNHLIVEHVGNGLDAKSRGGTELKMELMEVLACPLCKGDLQLEIVEQNGGEIVSGLLTCPTCRHRYPINEGIPNLLPPELVGR